MYNDQQPNPGSWQEEEQRMTLPPKRGLSRKGDKMDPQAKLGCILSIIGLCLGIAIFIYAAVTVYQNFPELIQQYQQLDEMYQGGM